MKKALLVVSLAATLLFTSCKEEQKRRGIDYNEIKPELALTPEQDKQFDEVVAKYKKIAEESRAAATADGAKPDRVEMFKKNEERMKLQNQEMSQFLDEAQMQKYADFVAKNSRKRPRYDDELLAQIKTELAMTPEQASMLEAANDAFERAYQDAHDFYHGNGELAKEYWDKYDAERKNALKQVLSEEQFVKFEEMVANLGHHREK